jgi:hypothetical protein
MAGYWFRQPRCHFCGALIERPDDGVVCWEESIESSGKWRAQNFAVAHNRCVPTERPFQCDALTQVNPGYLTGLALRFTRRMYEQVDVPASVRLICELFPDEAVQWEGLGCGEHFWLHEVADEAASHPDCPRHAPSFGGD